jgi:hypothetical protein
MTALTSAAIPAPAIRHIGLVRLVRVELLKIRTTRLSYGLLATGAAITALFAVLQSARALAIPDRDRVLAAKAIAAALAGAVFGLAGFAVSAVSGLAFMAARGYPVSIGAATFADWGAGHLVSGALLAAIGAVLGSLVRSQLAGVIGVFVWAIILESLIGGLFTAVRPYLPYTAATALAGTPLGGAAFGPANGVGGGTPLPFLGATALLVGLAAALAAIAARTTVRRDIT